MDADTETSYRTSLTEAGLTKDQAAVYEALVKNGPQWASRAALLAGLSRPLAYKVLDELIALGLVEKKDEPKKVAVFSAAHPVKLKDLTEAQLRSAENAKTALDGALNQIISDYNLRSGKPGVRFFEELEGVKAVLDDSLTSKTEIYSYADLESIEKYISGINKEYVRARERRELKKKGIVLDTAFSRAFLKNYAPGVTETKLMRFDVPPFNTVMQIYDNKISYITLSEDLFVGIIIADPHIYKMHRDLFTYQWSVLAEFRPDAEAVSRTRSKIDFPGEHTG